MRSYAILLVLAFLALAAPGWAAPEADFYAAPAGRDEWSGKRAEAQGNDGPFATLDRARKAVRALRQAEPERKRPIVLMLRGGTYALPGTFTLTPEDSGTEAAPVVYQAYPGEEPVLSGGTPITGWQAGEGGRWQVRIPEVAEGKWWFEQLTVNGQRRFRPVLPKGGYHFIAGAVGPSEGQSMNRFRFKTGDLQADWRNLSDVQVHLFHAWSTSRLPIREVDEKERVVTLAGSTWSNRLAELKTGAWYRIENVAEGLTEPGEWYLDRESGVLTYLPMPGEKIDQVMAVAPRLSRLVGLKGDVAGGTFVDHIRFQGLTFAHGGWNIGKSGYTTYQAEVILDGAVTARNARHCAFEGCVVRHTGTYGIDLGAGCKNVRVEGCELFDLGAGGVKIGSGKFNEETDPKMWADGCVVRDCLISGGGRIHPGGVGVWIGHAANNRVERNEIGDLYYSGVSVGWRWATGPSPAHHNAILGNHIHRIGQGVMSDMAGIYSLGESPGTVERLNHIHDVSRARYGGWGIYFDESSADIVVENNLVYRTEDAPFHLHHGRRLTVRNNIFAFGKNDQIKLTNMKKSGTLTVEGNLWYWREGELFIGSLDEEITFRRNLYWKVGGGAFRFPGGASREDWSKREEGMVVADPLFADPEKGDFTLKPGSPAAQTGFQPFDISQSGRLTKTARTANLPPVPRAFPPAPPEPPVVLNEDFEMLKPRQAMPGWFQLAASRDEDAHVIEGMGAGGSNKCLQVTDGPGGAVYFPHIVHDLKYKQGVVETSFDIRVEPGARVQFEWRDNTPHYTPGPSVDIDAGGTLKSGGKELLKLPHSEWVHIRMACGIGPDSTGTWVLDVTLPGQAAQRFEKLPLRKGFETFDWIGFASMAKEKAVYYIDNFRLHPVGAAGR